MSQNQREAEQNQTGQNKAPLNNDRHRLSDHPPAEVPDYSSSAESVSHFTPSLKTQGKVDRLIDYVNSQIDLLAFDDPEPFMLRQMVQCLADPRRSTRLSLVESFSQIGEPATPFLIEGITNHADSVVRRACCNALTNIGDPDSVPVLIKALTADPDIGVKSAAAGALAKVGAPAFSSLRDVLAAEDVSESCKGHAAWAMASMSSEVGERLYRIMSDPSAAVRTAVIGAIAQLAQKQTAQQNQPFPSSETDQPQPGQPQTRRQTDRPRIDKVQRAMTILTEALNDHSPEVKIEAAANLARLNCQKAYQPLVSCLKDPVAAVRKAAVLALAKLGNPDAIEAIAHLQQDAEDSVQRVATLVVDQLRAIAIAQKKPSKAKG
ncbi:MAG: glycosyl transferase family 2 [Leptolyngbya foveolarum]|uniref:Glycosyl transferase family 2 n=1 Tax=Leptolyngbya foveolarum TaxID=47253 RepID=A0A2W4U0X6_9CYAN|nr:MAG: glycosyl transferase family 2 [Leptolyngbya foveolarum]